MGHDMNEMKTLVGMVCKHRWWRGILLFDLLDLCDTAATLGDIYDSMAWQDHSIHLEAFTGRGAIPTSHCFQFF